MTVALALVILAGATPFDTLSSAQAECTMSCCAGKPPHKSGSCSAAFSDEHPGETAVSEHEHGGVMPAPAASGVIVEAPSHCGTTAATAEPSREKDASSQRTSHPAARVVAHALTTPCSPECAAVAASAFAQVGRQREAAALALNSRPRPSHLGSPAEHVTSLQTPAAVAGRQSSPRGPPPPLTL
jgi:hypothetical protein